MPDELPYEEDHPIPPGYHVEDRMRKAPVIAGSVMLGAGYLISVIGASALLAQDGGTYFAPLYIPVVGPFITVGLMGAAGDFSGQFGLPVLLVAGFPLILDGLLQTAGGITLVVGVESPKRVLVLGNPQAKDTTPRLRIGPNRVTLEGRF